MTVFTVHKSTENKYLTKTSTILFLDTKVMTEIDNPDGASLTVADVKKNHVVFTKFSLIKPPQLMVGKFDSSISNIGNLGLTECSSLINIPNEENLMYEHTEFIYESNEPVSKCTNLISNA